MTLPVIYTYNEHAVNLPNLDIIHILDDGNATESSLCLLVNTMRLAHTCVHDDPVTIDSLLSQNA